MRDPLNIRAVEQLDVDWMGFIFWDRSKRHVSHCPLYMPKRQKRVGVFVDSSIDDIVSHIEDYSLDIVQLHGSESRDYIERLKLKASASVVIIKSFNVSCASDFEMTRKYESVSDYFLFDSKSTLPGGSGRQFDWSVLQYYDGDVPFLLSGGIGPSDYDSIRRIRHPQFSGIDLNSGFEISPSLKDTEKLKTFLTRLNSKNDE